MNDFWQAFGRLAADDKFRNAVYKQFPVYNYEYDSNKKGIVIDEKYYDDLRKIIVGKMPQVPMSLMALGEILMCVSTDLFRDGFSELVDSIKATGIKLRNRSPLFYTALGLLLIDGPIVLAFAKGGNYFNRLQFGRLTKLERRDIVTIARDNTIILHASGVCYNYWSSGCYSQYSYYANHIHPTPKYPPTPMPKGRQPIGPEQGRLRGSLI